MHGTSTKDSEAAGADVDPDIRRFIDAVGAAFARYPDFPHASAARQRAIAEEVRAPWAAGGPAMARTRELTLPTRRGNIRCRLYTPSAASRHAALVYLHGGGWTLFSIDTHDRVMREYAARAGIAVIGLDYALSPEVRYPVALEQVRDALRWIAAHASELEIDAARIAVGGDSAGANLAVAACLALRDAGEAHLARAMLLNYGVFDLHCSPAAERRYGGAGYMLGSDEMREFWRNYAGRAADPADPLLCPSRARLQGLPPAFCVIAECDLLAEQNVAMATKLRDAGVPTEATVYAGASHSFLEAVSIARVSERAFADSARWLHGALGE